MADGTKVEADPLFTLDVVRDFMQAQGGKVSNHTLVTHFKSFLNDSQRKDANRQKFKEYVNALSTIKLDTSGEKLLVLKKKYRDSFAGGDLVKPNMPVSKGNKQLDGAKYAKMRQKQRAEKEKALNLTAKSASSGDLTMSVDEEKENHHLTGSYDNLLSGDDGLVSVPKTIIGNVGAMESLENSMSSDVKFVSPAQSLTAVNSVLQSEAVGAVPAEAANSISASDDRRSDNQMDVEIVHEDFQALIASVTSAEKEAVTEIKILEPKDPDNEVRKTEKRPLDEVDGVHKKLSAEPPKRPPADHQEVSETELVSVRERARHLNTVEPTLESSPVMRPPVTLSASHKPKRERESRRPDDCHSDSTMNETEREWTIRSAYSDYQAMSKLLLATPSLARRRDFLTGFTALHWAAKNGSTDVIKLLLGSEMPPDVNVRSGGGYTPLHVATIHGHEEVIDLLFTVYRADTTIRDYAGRRPKFYAPSGLGSRAHQLLSASSFMPRSGSYSAKIGRSTGSSMQDFRNTTPSPSSSPGPSSRKGSVSSDSGLMPPPRELPAVVRRRPIVSSSSGFELSTSAREKESLSDSEMHRADSDNELHGSESVPNIGSAV